jgi:hypothetical protein
MNVTFQGILTGGCSGKRITCTTTSLTINDISINNSSAYTFTLNRYTSGQGVVLIYTFILNAGDNVRDNEVYILNNGDYLELISDIPGTTYYISANQI